MEDVQVDRRRHGIAQRILLLQETGIGAGCGVEPVAPFIDDQGHLLLGIVFVHDRAMLGQQIIHLLSDLCQKLRENTSAHCSARACNATARH